MLPKADRRGRRRLTRRARLCQMRREHEPIGVAIARSRRQGIKRPRDRCASTNSARRVQRRQASVARKRRTTKAERQRWLLVFELSDVKFVPRTRSA